MRAAGIIRNILKNVHVCLLTVTYGFRYKRTHSIILNDTSHVNIARICAAKEFGDVQQWQKQICFVLFCLFCLFFCLFLFVLSCICFVLFLFCSFCSLLCFVSFLLCFVLLLLLLLLLLFYTERKTKSWIQVDDFVQ